MPTVFSALSPIKHSPPASTTTFSSAAKENASPEPYKSVRGTRKPIGPRSPAGTPPSTLRGQPSKENAHAHQAEKGERRRSQALRDVTTDSNVGATVAPARKAEKTSRSQDKENLSADTSKDSVRSRMKEWERERERLREMSRMREVDSEPEEDHEREREAERQREREWERERRRVEAERQQRLAELKEREEEEAGAEEDEDEAEICEVRVQPVRPRQREYILPKISVGPSLTPPANSPLSPLFEGKFPCSSKLQFG